MPARARTALVVLTTAALAACTSSTDGTPQPAADQPAGPLTEVLGELDLDEAVGGSASARLVVPHPDGHLVALIGPESTTNVVDTYLVDLVPGADGLIAEDIRELPTLDRFADLHVADDGTVILAGVVEKGPETGPRVLVVQPGADEPEIVDPGIDADYLETALSPDGTTLYVNPALLTTGPQDTRLLAVDVASGEVTADVALPPGALADALVTTADGTLTALLGIQTPEGAYSTRLVTYDADLEQLSDTELHPGDSSYAAALAVGEDGTAVVSLDTGIWSQRVATVLVVADGEVTEVATLDDAEQAPDALAVDAAGDHAYLPYRTDDDAAVLAVVELGTGEVTEVDLCDGNADFGSIALAPDGATATALGYCDASRSVAVLLGRG